MNILEQIAADTHIRVEKEKEIVSLSKVKDLALSLPAKDFARRTGTVFARNIS